MPNFRQAVTYNDVTSTLPNRRLLINMKVCCVCGCENSRKNSVKSFFLFPKNEKIREQWTARVRVTNGNSWMPEKNSIICSDHFTDDSFLRNRRLWTSLSLQMKRQNLKPGSLPTVFSSGCDRLVSFDMLIFRCSS